MRLPLSFLISDLLRSMPHHLSYMSAIICLSMGMSTLLTALPANQAAALDKIARIDGVYTEHFHNETKPFKLDSRALFTEFYFDVADNHKLTLGLRYTEAFPITDSSRDPNSLILSTF